VDAALGPGGPCPARLRLPPPLASVIGQKGNQWRRGRGGFAGEAAEAMTGSFGRRSWKVKVPYIVIMDYTSSDSTLGHPGVVAQE
jgi:hypothetical protein